MCPTSDPTLLVRQRRRARRLAIWNGAIWAIGNGLASTTLVIYLAKQLHAGRLGLGISLIVAAPHVVGLLRLGAPALIERLGDRKRFCIATFLLGALLLLALPWVCAPGRLPSPGWSLAALILLWCLYHLLQYLGMVACGRGWPTWRRCRFAGGSSDCANDGWWPARLPPPSPPDCSFGAFRNCIRTCRHGFLTP